jgi:hypothetical protein
MDLSPAGELNVIIYVNSDRSTIVVEMAIKVSDSAVKSEMNFFQIRGARRLKEDLIFDGNFMDSRAGIGISVIILSDALRIK